MQLKSDFLHKLYHYEYWPAWAFYAPVFVLWPLFAIRARSLLFFTVANPCIPHGGSFGESKVSILGLINPYYLPKSFTVDSVQALEQTFPFPVVAKPDIGERGDNIRLIYNREELEKYFARLNRTFIVQEYLTSTFEAGVMVYRDPQSRALHISSITTKEFLKVTGDGVSTLKELMLKSPRSRFQWERLKNEVEDGRILKKDEKLTLEPIGNHCRGTAFLNSNELATPELVAALDKALENVQEFYFGRFDLKADSAEHFKKGETLKIMELNGAFSEPGHIYDPKEKLWNAWRDLIHHWMILSKICYRNSQRGFKTTPILEFFLLYREYKKLNHMRS